MREQSELKLMIVDDDQFIRTTIRKILERDGYSAVIEAADGDDAVLLAEKYKPDIIIMDYLMKNMDGAAATEKIKMTQPDAIVIMLTQEARPSVVSRSMKAGAATFVMKSSIHDQLLTSLRHYH